MALTVSRVPTRRGVKTGEYVVTAYTNGSAAARIRVHADAHQLRAVGGGIIERVESAGADRVHIEMENYAQIAGIKPGDNELLFVLESPVGVDPSLRFRIEASTLVGLSKIEPYETGVVFPQATVHVSVGQLAMVPVRLNRRGGRPDRPVRLVVNTNSSSLRASVDHEVIQSLGTGKVLPIRLRADRSGTYLVRLGVLGNYNSPAATVRVVAEARGNLTLAVVSAICFLIASAGAVIVVRQLRQAPIASPGS